MTIIEAVKKLTPSQAARRPVWPEGWSLRQMPFGRGVLIGPSGNNKDITVHGDLFIEDYLRDDWEMVDLLADK